MKDKIFPYTFWRPFLDCMPQLFFRPKYVWFPIHLKGPMIPDPSGQLAELIVYITSTRVDLYSHQILLAEQTSHVFTVAVMKLTEKIVLIALVSIAGTAIIVPIHSSQVTANDQKTGYPYSLNEL